MLDRIAWFVRNPRPSWNCLRVGRETVSKTSEDQAEESGRAPEIDQKGSKGCSDYLVMPNGQTHKQEGVPFYRITLADQVTFGLGASGKVREGQKIRISYLVSRSIDAVMFNNLQTSHVITL